MGSGEANAATVLGDIMNDFDLRERSDKAMTWLVIWFMMSLIGTVWVVVLWLDPSRQVARFLFALILSGGGFVVASLFAMRYSRYNALMRGDDSIDDEPPYTDLLTFNQDTEALQEFRLVSTRPEQPQRLIIAGQLISMRKWRRLASTLSFHNWHFTRDVLAEAGTFSSLSTNFPKIKAEFVRLGWVIGTRVTPLGIEKISASSPPTLD
jgi:hypothetical protein